MKSLSLPFYCLNCEEPTLHEPEAMSAVTVFQVKFTLEFTSLTMNLSLDRMSFKRKQAHPQRVKEKEKSHFGVNCQ